ncbi:hypothetical protein EON63_09905 [archaeon]|nr:MAG: hypothetical protein EON63_09905 [archaeon]
MQGGRELGMKWQQKLKNMTPYTISYPALTIHHTACTIHYKPLPYCSYTIPHYTIHLVPYILSLTPYILHHTNMLPGRAGKRASVPVRDVLQVLGVAVTLAQSEVHAEDVGCRLAQTDHEVRLGR